MADGQDTTQDAAIERLKDLQSRTEVKADDVRDALPEKELIALSEDALKKIVEGVSQKFVSQIEDANGRIDELRMQLERKDAERHVKARGRFADDRVKVTVPRRFTPPDHMSSLVDTAKKQHDGLSGMHLRFCNNTSNIRSLRRAQGWVPVIDKGTKEEFRYMDEVLMTMPERKFTEEIQAAVEDRKAFNRQSVAEQFHDTVRGMGVEPEGTIEYDSGDDIAGTKEVVSIDDSGLSKTRKE